MDAAGDGDELRVAFPLWVVGGLLVAIGVLRRRPLLVLAGAATLALDHRAGPAGRLVATIGALMRRTHDDATG